MILQEHLRLVLAQPVVRRNRIVQLVLLLAFLVLVGDLGTYEDGFGEVAARADAEGVVEGGEVGGFVGGGVVACWFVGVEVRGEEVFGRNGCEGGVWEVSG